MKIMRPEQAGVSSANILQYIQILEENRLNSHSLIISRGDDIIYENYWAPFQKNEQHRMYSVSKSFVSLAIGFLEQDGLVKLDDPISVYFPKEMEIQADENMRNQTIRHMLMMSTAKLPQNWFQAKCEDRVQFYFSNDSQQSRPSGTIFQYDSTGSFVLGALVERVTGKLLMEYLREKLFRKIGVSEDAYCLKCPGGHSWGDSAIICTPMDLWKVARFTLNKGKVGSEQLLNEAYIRAATSKQIDNNPKGIHDYNTYGYGYLFWRTRDDSYFFDGMGCQMAICNPATDMIMVYTADNQGFDPIAKPIIVNGFFDLIVNRAKGDPLPEDDVSYRDLTELSRELKLKTALGRAESDIAPMVNGCVYTMNDNPMGITAVKLVFSQSNAVLHYTNSQGDKQLVFGMGHNVLGEFPEDGYSDCIGGMESPGNRYRCAASGAWIEPHKLSIKVQILDKYFGQLNITVAFTEDGLGLYMEKAAENFLLTYNGYATGKRAAGQ